MDVTLFTIDEAAARLRVSRWTVYKLIRSNQLRTIKIGRRQLVPPAALNECIELLGKEVACCPAQQSPHPLNSRTTPTHAGVKAASAPTARATISPRKDGRYEVKGFVLTTTGRLERKSAYARSYDEAPKKLTELLSQSDQSIPVASESWTVAEYLTYWLLHIVREERRAETYQGYELGHNPRGGRSRRNPAFMISAIRA